MEIELKEITVRELTNGYEDNDELGVRAYGGQLDVRPPYQREFVYKDKQRDAVIETLRKKFPLNGGIVNTCGSACFRRPPFQLIRSVPSPPTG